MSKKDTFTKDAEALRNLKALEAIENNSSISQRDLAERIGVALGIANACIHTLVRKGFIKIRGENNRKITYHLTKSGLLYKSQMALEWTKNTIDYYRQARKQVYLELSYLAGEGVKKVTLYGVNELTEIAVMVAMEARMEIAGLIKSRDSFDRDYVLNLPVSTISALQGIECEAVILCVDPDDEEKESLIKEIKKMKSGPKLFSLINWDEYVKSDNRKRKQ